MTGDGARDESMGPMTSLLPDATDEVGVMNVRVMEAIVGRLIFSKVDSSSGIRSPAALFVGGFKTSPEVGLMVSTCLLSPGS